MEKKNGPKRFAWGVKAAIWLCVMTVGLAGCGKTPETVQDGDPDDLQQEASEGGTESENGEEPESGTEPEGHFTPEYEFCANIMYELVLPEENEGYICLPQLELDTEHGSFVFFYDVLSSYLSIGSYKIEDDLLTAVTDDGRYTWLFQIVDEDTIIFIQEGSSEIKVYDNQLTAEVADGAEFRRIQWDIQQGGALEDTVGALEITDEIVTFQMEASLEETVYGVNITPEEITDTYGFAVYKDPDTCYSFLTYDGEEYPIDGWFGGYGVTSFAVADLNGDGFWELYYTTSWGSGLPRSEVGYFDSARKEMVSLEYEYISELVLAAEDNGSLGVYDACVEFESFVDIRLTAGDKRAEIYFDSGQIVLAKVQ